MSREIILYVLILILMSIVPLFVNQLRWLVIISVLSTLLWGVITLGIPEDIFYWNYYVLFVKILISLVCAFLPVFLMLLVINHMIIRWPTWRFFAPAIGVVVGVILTFISGMLGLMLVCVFTGDCL